MDPNKTLEIIRSIVEDITDGVSGSEAIYAAEELASAVDDLDQWMSKGGAAPKEWGERPMFTPDELVVVRIALTKAGVRSDLIERLR